MNQLEATIHRILSAAVENNEGAGYNALITLKGEDIAYTEAGWANVAAGKKITRDAIFRLYSQTKPITSAAVMLLMERGLLDVMDPVSKFLPGFDNARVITEQGLVPARRPVMLYDLLSMTAGCAYPDGDAAGQYAARLFEKNQAEIDAGGGMSTVDFCNAIGALPLSFQPGTAFRYSTCADVLGAVVEVVSGRPFADFLREEFFEPLGMKDTAFWLPEEKLPRLVTAYERTPEGLKEYTVRHLCVGNYSREPAFASGGAGLVSTIDDYRRFATMLLRGGELDGVRILRPATVEWMTKPQQASTGWDSLVGHGYGKLMRVCTDPGSAPGLARMGEYGWDGWLGTYFANFPDCGLTIQVFLNARDTGTCTATRKVRNAVLSLLDL